MSKKLISERLHACLFCPKRFDRGADLKRHINVHEGHRPHLCAVCGAAFSQKSGLKVHMNKHTGKKPYVCGALGCNRAFSDPSSCVRHRRERHENAGSYICPKEQCHSRIKRRSAFITHLKKKHGIDPKSIDIHEFQIEPKSSASPAKTMVIHQPTPIPAIVPHEKWYHFDADIYTARPDYPQYNALMPPYARSHTSTQLEETYPSAYDNNGYGYTYPSSNLSIESHATDMYSNYLLPPVDLESPPSFSSPSSSGSSSPMGSPPVEFKFDSIRWSPASSHMSADDVFHCPESYYEGLQYYGEGQYFLQ